MAAMNGHGDLNNVHAARKAVRLAVDKTYIGRSLAIPPEADEPGIRERYRPFLLAGDDAAADWVAELELSTVMNMVESQILDKNEDRLKILVLYGSLRSRCVFLFYSLRLPVSPHFPVFPRPTYEYCVF
jgi:arsenical resistance protein ArsH